MQKTLISLLALLCFSLCVEAQEVKTQVKQESLQLGTFRVSISFRLETKVDSIGPLIIDGEEYRNRSIERGMSMKNGKSEEYTSFTIYYKPKRTGKFKIQSPLIYVDGKTIQSKDIEFEVDDIIEESEWNEAEKEGYINAKTLKSSDYRLSFKEGEGILEVKENGEWTFKRKLSEKECRKLINEFVDAN